MHKGHYSDSCYVLVWFLGRFARSLAAISLVFRVYIIDPWIDHLQDYPMGRNPYALVHILGALHPQSGVAIRQLLRKLQSSPELESIRARITLITSFETTTDAKLLLKYDDLTSEICKTGKCRNTCKFRDKGHKLCVRTLLEQQQHHVCNRTLNMQPHSPAFGFAGHSR
jgi:hypothetical protein